MERKELTAMEVVTIRQSVITNKRKFFLISLILRMRLLRILLSLLISCEFLRRCVIFSNSSPSIRLMKQNVCCEQMFLMKVLYRTPFRRAILFLKKIEQIFRIYVCFLQNTVLYYTHTNKEQKFVVYLTGLFKD